MTVTDGTRAGSGVRSWLLNADAQVLTSRGELLIRRGDRVARCHGSGAAEFVALLLSTMNGSRIDVDMDTVAPGRRAEITGLLTRLTEAGLLTELPGTEAAGQPPGVLGLWSRSGGTVPAEEIGDALATGTAEVVGAGTLADRIRAACRESGLRTHGGSADPAVRVVVGSHPDDAAFTDWNRRAIASGDGVAWLAVTPFDGVRATVGPWFVPGGSACHRCYRLRCASTFPGDDIAGRLADAEPVRTGADGSALHPATVWVQAGMVADLLLEYVGLGAVSARTAPGALATLSVGNDGLGVDRHRVLRVPRCPECSPAAGRGYPQVWYANDRASTGGAR